MKKMLKVNPFQETLNASMCGPASLKILLSYYGVEKTEKELAKLFFVLSYAKKKLNRNFLLNHDAVCDIMG